MSSLYKRATPPQARILRIVEGAVKNAADAHPNYGIDRRFCRSVAKRAAGTLTAQWPEVLAAKPSDKPVGVIVRTSQRLAADPGKPRVRGPSELTRRSPLRLLHVELGILACKAKHDGNAERFAAIADCLRAVARLEKAGAA